MNDLIALTPECLDIANAYILYGSAKDTAEQLGISESIVINLIQRKDVSDYLTGVYLDRGFRNRQKIGDTLDKIIESKLEEAIESEVFSNKDLIDILKLAHQIRMDELKLGQNNAPTVQIANIGGNYTQLMEKLLK